MSSTPPKDPQALRVAGLCEPGRWPLLRPWLARLGAPDQGAGQVAGWLAHAAGGSGFEARRALAAVSQRRWVLEPAAGGGFTLRAGRQAWRLLPVPAVQPQAWQVSAAPGAGEA